MKTVLLSQEICAEARALLEGKVNVILPERPGQEAFEEMLPLADALILRTNVKLTRAAVGKADKLQIACRTGAGFDNVDLDACRERGIRVANTPDANTTSVVEHTVAMALALSKRLAQYDRAAREGNWKIRSTYASRELSGKTLGVVGYGRIGRRVAQTFRTAFGMKVLAYDPFLQNADPSSGETLAANVEDVFRGADIISLHCPSLPQTRGMVNESLLRLAKPDLILLNCARGDVVVEADLAQALLEGRIAAAGLDVFEDEPLAGDNPLCAMENVLLTPHTAALTREASIKVAVQAVEQALIQLDGGTPPYLV